MSLAALARDSSARAASPATAGRRGAPVAAPAGASASPAAHASPAQTLPSTSRADGFDNLVRYIPIETITVFVAVCSARSAIETIAGGFSFGIAYAACAALTPAVLWLIAAGRHRASGAGGPVPLHWWPLFASTAAFLVWALSVPGVTSMLTDIPENQAAWGVIAGAGAVLVSLLLSMLERVFGP